MQAVVKTKGKTIFRCRPLRSPAVAAFGFPAGRLLRLAVHLLRLHLLDNVREFGGRCGRNRDKLRIFAPYGTHGGETALRRHRRRSGCRGHDGRGNGCACRAPRTADRKDGEVGPQGPHHGQGTLQRDQCPACRGVCLAGADQCRVLRPGLRRVQQPGHDPFLRAPGRETRHRARRAGLPAQRQGVGYRQRTARLLRGERREDPL